MFYGWFQNVYCCLINQIKKLQISVNNNTKDIESLEKCCEEVKTEIENINTEIENINNEITTINNEITNIQGDTTEINQKIEVINQQIENINNEITNIQGDITTINEEIVQIKNQITEINNEITEIKNDITSLQNEVNYLKNYVINANARARAAVTNFLPPLAPDGVTTYKNGDVINFNSVVGLNGITYDADTNAFTFSKAGAYTFDMNFSLQPKANNNEFGFIIENVSPAVYNMVPNIQQPFFVRMLTTYYVPADTPIKFVMFLNGADTITTTKARNAIYLKIDFLPPTYAE